MFLCRCIAAFCVLALGCTHLNDEETSAPLGSVAMVGFDEFETPMTREQYEVLRYVRDPIEPVNRGFFAAYSSRSATKMSCSPARSKLTCR